jgi:hypothetical protein
MEKVPMKTALIAIAAFLVACNLAKELDDLRQLGIILQAAGLPALVWAAYRSFRADAKTGAGPH